MATRNDYNVLLEGKVWDKLEKKLVAGISNDYTKKQMSVVLENTRQALLSDTLTQNITYLPKLVLPR